MSSLPVVDGTPSVSPAGSLHKHVARKEKLLFHIQYIIYFVSRK